MSKLADQGECEFDTNVSGRRRNEEFTVEGTGGGLARLRLSFFAMHAILIVLVLDHGTMLAKAFPRGEEG